MKEPNDLLARARVASPCPASWEAMEGDERVRLCRLCNLNVYNFSGMTRAEVEALLLKNEGRLCGRLARRADGTVLTKDCPAGLRALKVRASRAAGAVFAALLSLCSPALGQEKTRKLSCERGTEVKVERKPAEAEGSKPDAGSLKGVVLDPAQGGVPDAEVTLTDEATKREFKAKTSDVGEFSLPRLPKGDYTLRVNGLGFTPLVVEHFEVAGGEDVSLTATLSLSVTVGGAFTGIISVVPYEPPRPDFESNGGKTVFRGRMLTDLPIPPEE